MARAWHRIAIFVGVCGCGSTPIADDPDPPTSEAETSSSTSSESDGDGDGDPGDGDPGDGDPGDGDGDGDGDPAAARVLFIGNSYTFANDLPGLVASLGAASPTPVITDSVTTAGARVIDHLQDPAVMQALLQDWDVVVIQGQSFEPILDYPTFEQAVIDLAVLAAQAGDPRILLFQTWPRRADSPDLVDLGMTVEQMWAGLESGYFEAGLASSTEVAPVGGAWMSALQLDPPIELYAPDASHPALAGSFLAGCVFFDMIVERACATSSFTPEDLAATDADRLRVIADIAAGIVDPSP